MKKQVISFLSLFGLVFVLSIYYVLLPTNLFIRENNAVNGSINDNKNDITINFTVEEGSNLFFSSLNSKLDEKHNSIIYSYESVVASSQYANEDKENALNQLNHELKIIENEQKIVSLIKDYGFYNAYVEYQEDIIKVIVQAESLSNVQAAELMSIVIDNSFSSLLPEIEYVI